MPHKTGRKSNTMMFLYFIKELCGVYFANIIKLNESLFLVTLNLK